MPSTEGISTRYGGHQYPVQSVSPINTILLVVKHAELMDSEMTIVHELIGQTSNLDLVEQGFR